ncbi:hypothetical protein EXIGLDRAFT_159691 [Exidia glandulosa HHB12029]|uniref:Uncharacterized protein n=1 Tax=Exidia glandulosa HHB12029 TaxID=1314781 RepID=A0A165FIS7_EXIGL|nr:hypothetical protein EXIGLDRAFT_159691 [Exidia glandulosa HHB12029]
MTTPSTLASMTLARMGEYRSNTRLLFDDVMEILLRLETGETVTNEIQTLRDRCLDQLRGLEANADATAVTVAADRSALKATSDILLEVQTAVSHDAQGAGLGAVVRNRFRRQSAAAVAAHVTGRRDEAAAWKARVECVSETYLIEKGVAMQQTMGARTVTDNGVELQLALRRVTATNPKTAAQTREEEMFEGVKRLLGIVELSSEQTAAILASRELVLRAAEVSEREREQHMRTVEAHMAMVRALLTFPVRNIS